MVTKWFRRKNERIFGDHGGYPAPVKKELANVNPPPDPSRRPSPPPPPPPPLSPLQRHEFTGGHMGPPGRGSNIPPTGGSSVRQRETKMSESRKSQFIGYSTNNFGNEYTPIAVGNTREDCTDKTIRRALAMLLTRASITVQQRDEIDSETFKALGETLDQFCVEHRIDQ